MKDMQISSASGKNLRKRFQKAAAGTNAANRQLLLLCLPALAAFLVFHYVPLVAGIVMPFKDYTMAKGIWGSAWCGLKNFTWIFKSTEIVRVVRNSLLYGIWFLFIGPIVNIIFALLLFDVRRKSALKVYQTAMCLPNFMSMVVVGFITYAILSPRYGVLNEMRAALGQTTLDVYSDPKYWPGILTIVNLWKGVGMGSLLYYAGLMGTDTCLYEAASIDGANHIQKTWFISIPQLLPIFCIQVILGIGGIVGGNFDLHYLIPRDQGVLYETTDIISTFVTRSLLKADYVRGSAVGLMQSFVGMLLVLGANAVIRRISPENSLF